MNKDNCKISDIIYIDFDSLESLDVYEQFLIIKKKIKFINENILKKLVKIEETYKLNCSIDNFDFLSNLFNVSFFIKLNNRKFEYKEIFRFGTAKIYRNESEFYIENMFRSGIYFRQSEIEDFDFLTLKMKEQLEIIEQKLKIASLTK